MKKNYHVFEDGVLRASWLSLDEANEMVERHQKCFPDTPFYWLQLDKL